MDTDFIALIIPNINIILVRLVVLVIGKSTLIQEELIEEYLEQLILLGLPNDMIHSGGAAFLHIMKCFMMSLPRQTVHGFL